MTKLLQWGVDNTDKESLAERAKAVREGRAQPQKLDMEVVCIRALVSRCTCVKRNALVASRRRYARAHGLLQCNDSY